MEGGMAESQSNKEYVNLLLRGQNGQVDAAEYCDAIVFALPSENSGSGKHGIDLITLSKDKSTFFVNLKKFDDSIDKYNFLLYSDVIKEFYCVEDFREDATPIMCQAVLKPTDEFTSAMNNAYRSKKFTYEKLFSNNATCDLIASDGQHMLVKIGKNYTFLPIPFCDMKNWKILSKTKGSKTTIKENMNAEIDNACKQACNNLKEYIDIQPINHTANFTRGFIGKILKQQQQSEENKKRAELRVIQNELAAKYCPK